LAYLLFEMLNFGLVMKRVLSDSKKIFLLILFRGKNAGKILAGTQRLQPLPIRV